MPAISAASRQRLLVITSTAWPIRNVFCSPLGRELAARYDLTLVHPEVADLSALTAQLSPITDVRLLPMVQGKLTPEVVRWNEKLNLHYLARTGFPRWETKFQGRLSLTTRRRRWILQSQRLGFKMAPFPGVGAALAARRRKALFEAPGPWKPALEQLRQAKPDLIWNAGPILPADTAYLLLAQGLGIPTVTSVLSWDNPSCKYYPVYGCDRYVAWGRCMEREFVQIFGPEMTRERVRLCGSPQFDVHRSPQTYWSREEFCARYGLSPELPVILYCAGTSERFGGEVEMIRSLIQSSQQSDGRPVQFLVRAHPRDPGSRWPEGLQGVSGVRISLPGEKFGGDLFAWTPSDDDLIELCNQLKHSAAVLNSGSTIALDASLLDRPVICLGYGDARRLYQNTHYTPIAESGAVELPGSEAETLACIQAAIEEPAKRSAARRALAEEYLGPVDGWAWQRILDVLREPAGLPRGGADRQRDVVAAATYAR
jgi:hypothetical protein